MKKLALTLLLIQAPLLLVILLAQPIALSAAQPNPADFPTKIHVNSSRLRGFETNGITIYLQYLETTIDSQPIELLCNSNGVLALGDYPARLSSKVHAPSKHPNTYDIYQGYDLLMPDKEIRTCQVVGLGPIPATNP